MMRTKFGQFIYTSLNFDKSPVKKPGYHIHYWTKSYLSNNDIENIESHIAYYKSASNPIKLQFFSLQQDKFVFVKTKLTDVVDEYNRKIFFAHGYILKYQTFSKVYGNNPFRIFDELDFYYELNNAIGFEVSGDIPEKDVNSKKTEIQRNNIPNWFEDYSRLRPILNLTLQAQSLVKTKKEVQIIGENSQIEDVLRIVLSLSPPTVRTWCSYDMHNYNCETPGKFWAIGLPEPINNSYILSALTGELNKTITVSQESPYEKWLRLALRKYGVQEVIRKVDKASFYIDTIFGKKNYSIDISFETDDVTLLSDLADIFFKEIDRKFNEVVPLLRVRFIPPISSLEKLNFLIDSKRSPDITIQEYFPARISHELTDSDSLLSDGFKKKRLNLVSVAFEKLTNVLKKKTRR